MKNVILGLLLVTVISGFLNTNNYVFAGKETSYKSSEDKFNKIKNNVAKSGKESAAYGADRAYKAIKKTLKDFKDLHEMVKDAKHIDDVINELSDGLEVMANTYAQVADMKPDILNHRTQNITNLTDLKGEVFKTIKELEIERQGCAEEIDLLSRQADHINDEMEKRKAIYTINGNKSIIKSLVAQQLIWQKFHKAQEKLINRLNVNGNNVDLLLHVLEINAKVYKEASTTAKLRRSAKDALLSLNSLFDLDVILNDLENSWLEINELVTEISNAEFDL